MWLRLVTLETQHERDVDKFACISYKNEEPSVPSIPEQTFFDASPKNHTTFRTTITSLIVSCKAPKLDVIRGKRTSLNSIGCFEILYPSPNSLAI
jgi:hypothetical protein